MTPPSTPLGATPDLGPKPQAGEVIQPHPDAPMPGAEAAPAPVASPSAGPAMPIPVPQVVPGAPAPVAAASAVPAPAAASLPGMPAPAVAGDVDVIEAEWVDKAEDVVQTHQGDPYGEEEAVEALQEDYLQKRYGLSVSEPDNGPAKPGPA